MAQAVQLGIEYDPDPPFDSGSPEKAPAEIVELVRAVSAASDPLVGGQPAAEIEANPGLRLAKFA